MKLQCDLCREIVVADFAVAGGAIEVHCPACARTFTVAATRGGAEPPAPPPRTTPGPMTCPKCGDAQPEAAACRTCGLLAERMPAFARDRDAGVAPEVLAAWRAVEGAWADPAAHERFLAAASTALAFPWAAQRYREVVRARPDDAIAAEHLARVARMAEATLLATAAEKPSAARKPYRGTVAVLGALLILIVIGVGYALLATSFRDDPGDRAPRSQPAKARPVVR